MEGPTYKGRGEVRAGEKGHRGYPRLLRFSLGSTGAGIITDHRHSKTGTNPCS